MVTALAGGNCAVIVAGRGGATGVGLVRSLPPLLLKAGEGTPSRGAVEGYPAFSATDMASAMCCHSSVSASNWRRPVFVS